MNNSTDEQMTGQSEIAITQEEVEQFVYDEAHATGDRLQPDQFPRMFNVSAGFVYSRMLRPAAPAPLEFVSVPFWGSEGLLTDRAFVAVSRWNTAWEAAQFRRRLFAKHELTPQMYAIADRGDVNVIFVPHTSTRYFEYATLHHLLPRTALERHAIPRLSSGMWPAEIDATKDRYLPSDYPQRLSRAWAEAVWPRLMPGVGQRAFSSDDPIRVLAHDLDYWVPPATAVAQEILRGYPLVKSEAVQVTDYQVELADGTAIDATIGPPRMGGDLWRGEEEAAKAVDWVVEEADREGKLRAVLDAIRSHRVHDDFSEVWSHAREDFERKLNHSRARVKVAFVELPDSVPVQGPETEVLDDLFYGNFLALLDAREREVVVLLRSGVSKLGDVAELMGYATHSPISKRLASIRRKASAFFSQTSFD